MATDTSGTKQRLRIIFTRDETLKYIGHLDMSRTWQRILRRADLPLAYSEGFNPQPRMSFAAALPVGCTSTHEEMDLILSPAAEIEAVRAKLERALPPGITLVSITEMPLNVPALQMQLRASEFEITVEQGEASEALADRVQAFLNATEVIRDRRGKVYNLRPLVQSLEIAAPSTKGVVKIRAVLQATPEGTGRPEELAAALGLVPAAVRIHRTKLIFLDKTT